MTKCIMSATSQLTDTIIPEISFKTWRMNLEEENCFQSLGDAFQRGDHMAKKNAKSVAPLNT